VTTFARWGSTATSPSTHSTDGGCPAEIEVPTLDVHAQGEGAHLFSPTGFLDDIWWHRSYWVFGRVWKSGAGGYFQAGRVNPAGRPMVFDDTTVYGYGRKPQYYRWTTPLEGAEGALLWAVSTGGEKLAEYKPDSIPAWDAMAASHGRLYLATTDGNVRCFGE
jgi:hypothetical protein